MIRAPTDADQSYIGSTWARSLLSMHDEKRPWRAIGRQLDRVMDRDDTRALIACHEDDPAKVLGWIVYVVGPRTPVVHYLYVRTTDPKTLLPLRGRGVAGSLLARIGVRPDVGVVCTSHGPSSQALRGRYRASVHMPLAEFLGG